MYFKVIDGTSLFAALQDLYITIVDTDSVSSQFASELGAKSYVPGWDYVAGKPCYFHFGNDRPDYFLRWAEHPRQLGFWFPKRGRRNKELMDRIKALPSVSNDELNQVLNIRGFQWYYRNGWPDIFRRPQVSWGYDTVLVQLPDGINFKPVEDMIPLDEIEYERLRSRIKQKWFQPCKEIIL